MVLSNDSFIIFEEIFRHCILIVTASSHFFLDIILTCVLNFYVIRNLHDLEQEFVNLGLIFGLILLLPHLSDRDSLHDLVKDHVFAFVHIEARLHIL